MADVQLILGGARSGKSQRALSLAEAAAQRHVFIATAEALDAEMATRISRHKQERGSLWTTIEAPLELIEALDAAAVEGGVCLIDCLTLWLSNLMHHERDIDHETDRLCDKLKGINVPVVLVSNEVGMGLVPDTPLGRAFRDAQGRLNQRVATVCSRVEFVAAGLPMTLKG